MGTQHTPELLPVSQNHVTLLQMEVFCIICLICLAVSCFHCPFILPQTSMGHMKTFNNVKMWLKHHYRLSRFIQSGVLYACENWCVTLRKEYGLEVFENRILTDLYLGDGRPRPRWKNDIKLVLRNRMGGLEEDSLSRASVGLLWARWQTGILRQRWEFVD